MLVLSRLRDETIMIGDDIELTVVDIRGDKVRIHVLKQEPPVTAHPRRRNRGCTDGATHKLVHQIKGIGPKLGRRPSQQRPIGPGCTHRGHLLFHFCFDEILPLHNPTNESKFYKNGRAIKEREEP